MNPKTQPQDESAPAPAWPDGWALPLIESPATTASTRRALLARLETPGEYTPQFFDADAFETLQAACARLVPSTDLDASIDVAPAIDRRLAAGRGDGWRYATLPPDGEAFRLGVAAIDAAAETAHAERFADLAPADQDSILANAQHARSGFDHFDARHWFTDWLAEAAGQFFAHPLVQQDIGYAGFADAPGWHQIELGEREDREPTPLTS